MFDQPQFQVQVLGGSFEENQQMCAAVHAAMQAHGFKNAVFDEHIPSYQESPLLAQIRSVNPDLLDNNVSITGMCEYDLLSAKPHMAPKTYLDTTHLWNANPSYPSFGAF